MNFRPVSDRSLVAACINTVADVERLQSEGPRPDPPTTHTWGVNRRERASKDRKFARKVAKVARWGLNGRHT